VLSAPTDEVCTSANDTQNSANGVQNYVNELPDFLGSGSFRVGGYLQTAEERIGQLQADFAKLTQDKRLAPGYSPADTPTGAQVASAISQARAEAARIRKTVSQYLAAGRQVAAQADAYVAEAREACKRVGA
jgi:hypothetical protein